MNGKKTLRAFSMGVLLCHGAMSCGSPEAGDAPDMDTDTDTAAGPLSVEDVHQYDDCLLHGVGNSWIHLGELSPGNPCIRYLFSAAECIVGRHTMFDGNFRPYNLQSFKMTSLQPNTRSTDARFFFKRVSENLIGEAPSQCLKIKATVMIGATDCFITITRVKQLPPATRDQLCSDNGEI